MLTRSTSIPRPKISVATRIRFSKALKAVYRLILHQNVKGQIIFTTEISSPFLLRKTRMNANTWEVTRHEQLVQLDTAGNGLNKDDNLYSINDQRRKINRVTTNLVKL